MEAKIKAMPDYNKFEALEKSTGKKVRCKKEDADHVFVFAKGKKRYGWRHSVESFCRWFELVPEKDKTAAWRRRMKSVVKTLAESGLWPEVKSRFEDLLTWGVTWEEKHDICDLSFSFKRQNDPDWAKKVAAYAAKYPKIVYKDANGDYVFAREYLYELSDCRTKSMYFGKWDNKRIKDEIKKCLESKTDYSARETVGYDVLFTYRANHNKAWYSEEYRGCGNGHYYLALNNSQALFCEDD